MSASPNGMGYLWDTVEVLEYDINGNIVFGPTPVSALLDPNNYIELSLWRWESGVYYPDTTSIDAYEGYWVKAKKANVFLRFPATAQVKLSNPRTLLAFTLKEGQRLFHKWVLEPQNAMADSDDTPPPPMADFSVSYQSESTKAGGSVGCFVGAASGFSEIECHRATGALFWGFILFVPALLVSVVGFLKGYHRVKKHH